MSRSTSELLAEALTHFRLAMNHAAQGPADQLIIDAVSMRLAAGIEVLARMDPAIRSELFSDTWPLMWGMRNRIAHGYALLSPEIVTETVRVDLPEIIAIITAHRED